MQANPNSFCSPAHPTGVLTILGTDDFVSPYNGIVFGGIEYYISAAATHRYWATHNNCDTTAAINIVSPSVERYTWSTASGCAYVEELKVIGGGHDWPGSFGNMTIDANIEIWKFVSRYDINGLIGCITTSINEDNVQNDNKIFSNNKVSIKRVLQSPYKNKKNSSIVIITHRSKDQNIQKTLKTLAKKSYIIQKPKLLRIENG